MCWLASLSAKKENRRKGAEERKSLDDGLAAIVATTAKITLEIYRLACFSIGLVLLFDWSTGEGGKNNKNKRDGRVRNTDKMGICV